MNPKDIAGLIHPTLAVAVVFPIIGMVLNLAWQTRQRRLQTAEEGKSKIPPVVGPEHRKIGNWLTGSVVGISLVAIAYSIYFKGIFKDFKTENTILAILIVIIFIATLASLVFLYKAKTKLWRGIFATLTGTGLVVLGFQDGVFRRDYEWAVSHFYYGIIASMLMIFSLAIVPEIYRDRTHKWRKVHTILNCLAVIIFLGQGITGSRDLLEIPLSWQQQHLYKCDWEKQVCPDSKSQTLSSEILVASISNYPTLAQTNKVLASGEFITITPGEDTEGTAQIIQVGSKTQVRLAENFSAIEGPAVRLLLHKQNVPESYTAENYVRLGDLKSFTGEQFYDIPEGINWQNFPNVVVWCEKFNVTFGSAKLIY
ncbi:DM13 domain-containing protein [Okeania sp.]|uniref:DM13 domain-containing protein n=1 Tax=Okeania sp. TaxID=3100323 RepID=UPI002B4B628C|nr:DM13 domain-containing protein [Okeania sp.]MEB3342963.1 DM13 domain-containing protein [Okeania sp.]